MATDLEIKQICEEFYLQNKKKKFPCIYCSIIYNNFYNLVVYLEEYKNNYCILIKFKTISCHKILIYYNSLNELINQVKLILNAYL